jgi:hypothetical protein
MTNEGGGGGKRFFGDGTYLRGANAIHWEQRSYSNAYLRDRRGETRSLVSGRSFHVIDYDDFDRAFAGFEFQAELLLKGGIGRYGRVPSTAF